MVAIQLPLEPPNSMHKFCTCKSVNDLFDLAQTSKVAISTLAPNAPFVRRL